MFSHALNPYRLEIVPTNPEEIIPQGKAGDEQFGEKSEDSLIFLPDNQTLT